jgi:tRNA G10  N-methylase Trm11
LHVWDLPLLELTHIHTGGIGGGVDETTPIVPCDEVVVGDGTTDGLIRNQMIHYIDWPLSQLNTLIHAVQRSTLIHGLYTLCAYGRHPSEVFEMMKTNEMNYVPVVETVKTVAPELSPNKVMISRLQGDGDASTSTSTVNVAVGVLDNPWLQRSYVDPIVSEAKSAMRDCGIHRYLEKRYIVSIDSESDYSRVVCIPPASNQNGSSSFLKSRRDDDDDDDDDYDDNHTTAGSIVQMRLFSASMGSSTILAQQLAIGLCSPMNSGQGHVDPFASATALRRPSSGILSRLSLKHMPFKSKTTMEPELALIMSSLAGIKNGSTVLDPYCGSCSLLAMASIHGAGSWDNRYSLVGVDANLDALSGDGIRSNFEYMHTIINSNRNYSIATNDRSHIKVPLLIHGLAKDLLLRNTSNSSKYSHHHQPSVTTKSNGNMDATMITSTTASFNEYVHSQHLIFDAIITDPPYGIKESFRSTCTTTSVTTTTVTMPSTQHDDDDDDDDNVRMSTISNDYYDGNKYSTVKDDRGEETSGSCDPDEAISTLLLLADRYLKKGGRLVTFLSHRTIDHHIHNRRKTRSAYKTHDELAAISDITRADGGIIPDIIAEHNIPQSLRLITIRRQLFSPTLSRYLCVLERR